MLIRRKIPWTSQPQQPVRADPNGKYYSGLAYHFSPFAASSLFDAKQSVNSTDGTTIPLAITSKGRALGFTTGDANDFSFAPITTSAASTYTFQMVIGGLNFTGNWQGFVGHSLAGRYRRQSLCNIQRNGGNDSFYIYNYGSSTTTVNAKPSLFTGAPRVLTIQYLSPNYLIYVDGILVDSLTVTDNCYPGDESSVGFGQSWDGVNWGGANVVSATLWHNKVWDAGSVLELAQNINRILLPQTRNIWVPSAGGVQSFSYSASGGMAFGGAATKVRGHIPALAGGVSLGGTSAEVRGHAPSPSGGILLAGAGTAIRGHVPSPSGGLQTGGAATEVRGRAPSPSGGMAFSGDATKIRGHTSVPSGGLNLGGHATESSSGTQTFNYTPAGGLSLSGLAGFVRGRLKSASGGTTFGGSAAQSRGAAISPSGGLQLSGSVTPTRSRLLMSAGGLSFSGIAAAIRSIARVPSGGFSIAGAAAILWTYIGIVFARNRLSSPIVQRVELQSPITQRVDLQSPIDMDKL